MSTKTDDVTESVTPDVSNLDTAPEPTSEIPKSDDPETFPREYVEKLRDENAKYRQRAGQTDEMAQRLHLELVKGTGRLADPSDLPFDADHIDDPTKMVEAIDALLAGKPHLGNRKPTGNIGQGASAASDSFSLSGLLRGNAR